MKKILCLLTALVLAVSFVGCKKSEKKSEQPQSSKIAATDQDREYVNKAIKLVQEQWESRFAELGVTDGQTKIVYTRLFWLKEERPEKLKGVQAVVEFDLQTFGYPFDDLFANPGVDNAVTFYENGAAEVRDAFGLYRRATYDSNFSAIIDRTVDFGTEYNTESETVTATAEQQEYMERAVKELKSYWKTANGDKAGDGTLQIVNSQLALICKDISSEALQRNFKRIEAVVTFDLYSDLMQCAPYYQNNRQDNTVIFYRDGRVEVVSDYFLRVRSATYQNQFGEAIAETVEFGAAYNEEINLKE